MSERMTEAELRAIEAKDPNDAGEDRWPVRNVQRIVAEVRRLREIILEQGCVGADPYVVSEDVMDEAEAIRKEQ